MTKLIAFTGKLQSGKTTAADILIEHGRRHGQSCAKLSFAEPVRDIARQLGWDGKKDDRGRRLLQLIGTECGRFYDRDIWVKKMKAQIQLFKDSQFDLIVIDDCRFNNEADLIHSMGGIVVKVIRIEEKPTLWKRIKGFIRDLVAGKSLIGAHASERGIKPELIDATIVNDKDVVYLEERTKSVAESYA